MNPCARRLGLWVVWVLLPAESFAGSPLFSEHSGGVAPDPTIGVRRARVALLDPTALACSNLSAGAHIELNLFSDARFTGIVRRGDRGLSGAVLRGVLAEDEFGEFELAISHDAGFVTIAGEVRSRHATYRLASRPGPAVTIEELDETSIPMCDVLTAPAPADPLAAAGRRDATHVDLLVAYTPAAAAYVGGTTMIRALARQYVLNLNQYLEDSLVASPRVRLVGLTLTPYAETGSYLTNITRLREPNDGFMDELHPLRDALGADLVALLADVSDVCGVAWLFSGDPAYAFSLTSVRCTSFTFAHEIGHNFGCCHDRDNSGGGCFTPNSYGYRFHGLSGTQWRTIMAYAPGTRIGRYSNPGVSFDGQPAGTTTEYNAATIPLTAPSIAAYRVAMPLVDCDGNRIADWIDIAAGAAADANGDGAIDGCGPCPGDLDGDGFVELNDLTTLLSHFGTPAGAGREHGDLDGDGDVELEDLTLLLSLFGTTCP